LNNLGKKVLNFIKKDFKFCDKAIYKNNKIYGKLANKETSVSEQQRLKSKTHLDLIRAIAFKFKLTKPFAYCGLFGIISGDFEDHVGNSSENKEDLAKDPNYVFYFLDNMFVVNHKTKKTYFVANALITDNKNEKIYQECSKVINNYGKVLGKKIPKAKKSKKKELKISYDADDNEFLGIMRNLKGHILDGSILYAAPSRNFIADCNAEPLDIYAQLKNADSGNYMVYMNDKYSVSISSGAKASLSVEDGEVELRILTATKPRAITKDDVEKDLDNKYEALLRVDEDETAYNMMLVDAMRNDVARISEQGTRYVDKMLVIEKQGRFQGLVSSVKGTLKKDLDALHAYAAAMNPSTVNGIPKIKSMQLLRGKNNMGSVLFISPNKDLKSMAIEPIIIKKDKVHVSSYGRVFNNSSEEDELKNEKTAKIVDAIKNAGGLK